MKKFMMLFAATMLVAFSASALDLQQAKKAGQVKEEPTGYLTAIDPAADALVKDINAKRRAEYEAVAAKNKQPVDVVEKLMGSKLAR